MKLIKCLSLIAIACTLNACIGTAIGAAVGTTVAVAKVPFKVVAATVEVGADVAGAVISVPGRLIGGDEDEED